MRRGENSEVGKLIQSLLRRSVSDLLPRPGFLAKDLIERLVTVAEIQAPQRHRRATLRPEEKDGLGRITLELGVVDPPHERRNLGEDVRPPRDYDGEPFLVFARWSFQINWSLLRAIQGEEIVGDQRISRAACRAGKRLECPLQLVARDRGVLGREDPLALQILASDEQPSRLY